MLYPYRRSAIKNQQRWSFGILYPPAFEEVQSGTERSVMHSECLIEIKSHPARLDAELRFLQLAQVGNDREEGIERSIELTMPLPGRLAYGAIQFSGKLENRTAQRGSRACDRDRQMDTAGIKRNHHRLIRAGLWGVIKLTIEVINQTRCHFNKPGSQFGSAAIFTFRTYDSFAQWRGIYFFA